MRSEPVDPVDELEPVDPGVAMRHMPGITDDAESLVARIDRLLREV